MKTVKLLFLSLALALLNLTSRAQMYQFNHTSGTYSDLTGATVISKPGWNDNHYLVKPGFNFTFFGKSYDSLEISDDAAISLGETFIDALGADMMQHPVRQSRISYALSGAAPNRIFKVEWKNAHFYGENFGSGTSFVNLQIWLYETTSRIEIHFGNSQGVSGSYFYLSNPLCAIVRNLPSSFYMLEGSASAPSLVWNPAPYSTIDSMPPSGKIYSFEPGANPAVIQLPGITNELKIGYLHDIEWISNKINLVNIEYSINNGAWQTVKDNVDAKSGIYRWTVPGPASNNCRIRISDASNYQTADTSKILKIIVPPTPTISISEPNGGEVLKAGKTSAVSYYTSFVDALNIEYSTDGGNQWHMVRENYQGFYFDWKVPNTPSNKCLVKISDYYNPSVFDISDNFFTIIPPPPPSITILNPKENQYFAGGGMENITWDADSVDVVKIEYSIDGGTTWLMVQNNLNSPYMYYYWTVPKVLSENCRLKISSVANPAIFAVSDRFIIGKSLFLTNPIGGENWNINTKRYITWEAKNNVYSVDLYYSLDGGVVWKPLASNIPSFQKYYEWNVPSTPSSNCKIKIRDSYDPDNFDISRNPFTLSFAASTGKIKDSEAINVYPNPSNGIFNIWIPHPGEYQLSVFNQMGRRVISKTVQFEKSEKSIDCSDLPPGLYLIELAGENHKDTRKIIIE